MKLTTIAAAAVIALAGNASAWRVYLHSFTDFRGLTYTKAGPGGTGSKCHNLPEEYRYTANSITYYAYNSQTNPSSRCKITLYDTPDCDTVIKGPSYSVDTKKALPEDWRNRVYAFKTECWAV
ncbi:hypothetical protein N657DRAFT_175478 [Parathielavia appendiculata]|uniref:Uncharacterized protein n=1 Tax=Parathielavia appendiculata TaxID=2587402 RepID=A0AAN6U831_9PEZI|nr:hypothetical protein N657DRAFT_175478 [Parathielavia appendiculata]